MSFSPSSKSKKPSPILTYFLLLFPLILLAFYIPNIFPRSSCTGGTNGTTGTKISQKPEFRLLIAIVTMPQLYVRRNLLRTVFSLQTYDKSVAEIDIRYVFCKLTNEEQSVFISLEILQYNDIIILDCNETVTSRKTFALMSTLPNLYSNKTYDFVMKADDDSYILLDKLVGSLRNKPKEDMYYGLKIPCDKEHNYPFEPFMEGMGYVISWDLVEYIAVLESVRKEKSGPEDMWIGLLFNLAGVARNRYDMNPKFYDYKGNANTTCFRHDFIPDSILVHRLKVNFEWTDTLKYFNVTSRLKPSKLYAIS